jgi:hypothetical protein
LSLYTKYPELEPLTMFFESERGCYDQHEPMPVDVKADVMFIFGIFSMSKDFKTFMQKHPEIEVVFLVETLPELLFFVKNKMDKGFDSERIHVQWKDEELDENAWIESVVTKYPYNKAHFVQNGLEDDRFNHLKRTFLRKIVLESSVHQELMHYPLLCRNLFSNIPRVSKAFDIGLWKDKFKGVPAVIAGAGPSLAGARDSLKSIEDKALIFAGGTTISSLSQMGIEPHMLFAIDPNFEEYDRLRLSHSFTSPLIYGNRVQKDVFRFFAGEFGYIKTDTGGLFETFVDKELGIKDYGILKNLSEEALSVTTIALMTAIYLGCDPIYFAGVDLGFKKNARYSGNIVSSWEGSLKKDELRETKWMMEKDVIDEVAMSYPDTRFYDATGDGLTFKKIPVKRIEGDKFDQQRNLRSRIDDLVIDSKFEIKSAQVSTLMMETKKSMLEMQTLIRKFLDGEMIHSIFVFEIERNKAFKIFFQGMVYAMQTPLLKKIKSEKKEISDADLAKQIFGNILKSAMKLSSLI